MITCQACGTTNPDGASFCSKCARKLDTDTQRRVVQQRAEHTATGLNWSAILIAGVIVVVIVVAVALLVTGVI